MPKRHRTTRAQTGTERDFLDAVARLDATPKLRSALRNAGLKHPDLAAILLGRGGIDFDPYADDSESDTSARSLGFSDHFPDPRLAP